MKIRKLSRKRNVKDKTNMMLMMLVSIFVLTLTVGYAALNKEVKISSEGTFKVEQDIRITDLRIDEVRNTALENYENDYAKDSIKVGVTLPELNSSISYKVEVTNTGTVAQWIDSIDDLVNNNSDMEYTLEGITTRQLIYPGEVKEFDIKIKYKEGIKITNDTIDLLIKLNFVKPVSVLAGGNSYSTTFFNTSPINKTEVESIEFLPTLDVGENALGSWDASYEKNGTVIAWYTDTDSNNLYELYIGGVGEVQTPVNASNLFNNFNKVTSIDFNNYINTENTTNMASLFYNCTSLTELDVSKFNTSKVTNMAEMFQNLSSIESLDLKNFSVSNVSNMGGMFSNCRRLKNLNLKGWNTSSLVITSSNEYNGLFSSCSSLESLDLSTWNTSKIKSMNRFLFGCTSLKTVNVTNFVGANVTDITEIFRACSSLTEIDVSTWDVSNVTAVSTGRHAGGAFSDCTALIELDLSNWNLSKVNYMYGLFSNCRSLKRVDISNFGSSNSIYMPYMFAECYSLEDIIFPSDKIIQVSSMQRMFYNCYALKTLDLSNFYLSNASMERTFYNCQKLEHLNIKNLDLSTAKEIGGAFIGVPSNVYIVVKDQTSKDTILGVRSDFTNIQIAAS